MTKKLTFEFEKMSFPHSYRVTMRLNCRVLSIFERIDVSDIRQVRIGFGACMRLKKFGFDNKEFDRFLFLDLIPNQNRNNNGHF